MAAATARDEAITLTGAGVWPRFLAQLFDAVIVAVAMTAVQLLLNGASTENLGPAAIASGTSRATALLAWLVASIVYFIVTEAAFGTTAGKWLLGLVVVTDDGADIGWKVSSIRNLARLVDGLGFYVVGAIAVWSTSRRQRLGDLLAHTLVVRQRQAPRLRTDGTHILTSQVPLAGTSPQPPHMTAWLPNPSEDPDELPPPSALPTWEFHPDEREKGEPPA